jgi:hypothetical protein
VREYKPVAHELQGPVNSTFHSLPEMIVQNRIIKISEMMKVTC